MNHGVIWLLLGWCIVGLAAEPEVSPAARAAVERFGQGPAVFIENQGQWEEANILFALNSQGANVGLTVEGPRFQLFRPEPIEEPVIGPEPPPRAESQTEVGPKPEPLTTTRMHAFALRFLGARQVTPTGERQSGQVFNYRRGEQGRWRESVPSWETVLYRSLYEGVDLRVSGYRSAVKYEFIVAAGADWQQIRLRYEGIAKLALTPDGGLLIHPADGWDPLRDAAPVIYQEIDGQRLPVAGGFRLANDTTAAYQITGLYDKTRALVIDPLWQWE